MRRVDRQSLPAPWRFRLVVALFVLAAGAVLGRAVELQLFDRAFLQGQGQARYLRTLAIPAHRGMILDRRGEPLAVSTPVDSVWANPRVLLAQPRYLVPLAEVLEMTPRRLSRLVHAHSRKAFLYLARHVPPTVAQRVRALKAPGVYLQREYARYYPTAEVSAQLLGITDIDDSGQEGLELAYDRWLHGEPGAMRVLRDGRHHLIRKLAQLRAPRPGRDLVLSIDRRIQYLAYRELKRAVRARRARGGSAVVLDVRSGEVLAMVNQPSCNPNDRRHLRRGALRNRAITDLFEPGSTMKPFTIAAALESGRYSPHTPIDTAPGFLRVGRATIRDDRNFGALDVTGVIRKSSNVGATKIALSLPPRRMWNLLTAVGFGRATDSGFPGEAAGILRPYDQWHRLDQATIAFGYGLSVTPLQLARAYATLAAGGLQRPVSLLRQDRPPAGERVIPAAVARAVDRMLEEVVTPAGTAPAAAVAGYRVAGKTGTVHKSIAGGYSEDHYVAVFAGFAPASRPVLVTVVMIDDPRRGSYYGGKVAAPVFSRIMAGALRVLNVEPDAVPAGGQRMATRGGGAA